MPRFLVREVTASRGVVPDRCHGRVPSHGLGTGKCQDGGAFDARAQRCNGATEVRGWGIKGGLITIKRPCPRTQGNRITDCGWCVRNVLLPAARRSQDGSTTPPPSFSPQQESRDLYLSRLGRDTQDASPLSQGDRSGVDHSCIVPRIWMWERALDSRCGDNDGWWSPGCRRCKCDSPGPKTLFACSA